MGTLRDRGGGKWELIAEAGTDPVTGKRRQVSKTFEGTKREARHELQELDVRVRRDGVPAGKVTLSHAIERWLELRGESLAPRTLYTYRVYIDRHISPALGRKPLARLAVADLDAFYLALHRSGLAPATVRQVHAIIRRALREAVRSRWIRSNPATDDPWLPSAEDSDHQPPPVALVLKLVAFANERNPEFAVMLIVAADSGARRGELCALRWSSIDWNLGTLRIARSISQVPGSITEKATKTHQGRRPPLSPGTIDLLRSHRGRAEKNAASSGVALPDSAYVFSDEPDGSVPWQPDRVTAMFRRLRSKVDADNVRFHDLRHFSATQLLDALVPLATVSARLGHRRQSTTSDIYGHPVSESDRAAAGVMDRLLHGKH